MNNFATQKDFIGLDVNEAPEGFYAVLKKESPTINVCNSCDARKLCQENKDDWCLKNRCMSFGVIAFKDKKVYERKDKKSVFFRKINNFIGGINE